MAQFRLPKWLTGRWVSLVGAMWIMCSGGLAYAFSVYSSAVKESMGYTQHQLNTLGIAFDIGGNVGLFSGLLSPLIPDWAMLLIGAIQSVVGFSVAWLAITHRINLSLWQLFFFLWLGNDASPFFNTVSLVTCVTNFPLSRGMIVGILKGLVGLSAAIYSRIYTAFFGSSQLNFLLLSGFGPAIVALITIFMIRPADIDDIVGDLAADEESNLIICFSVAITVALIIMVNIILSAFNLMTSTLSRVFVISIIVILAFPVITVFRTNRNRKGVFLSLNEKDANDENSVGRSHAHTYSDIDFDLSNSEEDHLIPLLRPNSQSFFSNFSSDKLSRQEILSELERKYSESDKISSQRSSFAKLRRVSTQDLSEISVEDYVFEKSYELGENMTVLDAMATLEFWCLVISMMCGAGSAVAVIGNLAQIGLAQGIEDTSVPVALVSVWNFAGRVFAGFYSEHLLRKYLTPRPLIVAIAQGSMIIGQLLIAFAVPGSVYIGSLIIGVGNGISYAMLTAITSELFGLSNFGILYNVLLTFVPIASYLFSSVLAGTIYDIEAAKDAAASAASNVNATSISTQIPFQTSQIGPERLHYLSTLAESSSTTCYGAHCFRVTCIILSMSCSIGMMANLLLVIRTRSLYNKLYGRN